MIILLYCLALLLLICQSTFSAVNTTKLCCVFPHKLSSVGLICSHDIMKIFPVLIFLVESVYIFESHFVQVTEADGMSQVTGGGDAAAAKDVDMEEVIIPI